MVFVSPPLRHPGEGRIQLFLFIPAKTYHLVIPAEAGIHLLFLLIFLAHSETRLTSL